MARYITIVTVSIVIDRRPNLVSWKRFHASHFYIPFRVRGSIMFWLLCLPTFGGPDDHVLAISPWVAQTRENTWVPNAPGWVKRENTWFQLGATMLDSPVGNLENHQPKKLCQVITHLVSIYRFWLALVPPPLGAHQTTTR